MKKYVYLTLSLVLTAALLVGCGCTNQNKNNTTAPNVLPTNEEIWDTTEAPTRTTTESTMPGTVTTHPSETTDRGNGPLDDMLDNTTGITNPTDTTTASGAAEGRSRSAMPGRK